ncbi:MAG: tetrathionate reductase family octaheme c-type cytochrome [Anaerolineae bacterium]|nr:tetrathionate reductase family octaheme c-type cytochrome [Anaerolineae bacterium]MCO5186641.1 tetrathionate reductase family octaheme c-type cytochrome [Anaerolineae bacterium]MCO5195772.1 tetrathionate reductase family octaheme c-type cytochrome [Anaerolineae bacterium]MCO5198022.1 tetrathionate reductase family octaheme c-type cytochrome [Anaerolineae bacterium]MCO5206114.1 tetrathionate reductase family octaheme c-type cytochrome [Anaerolineae bacterium]
MKDFKYTWLIGLFGTLFLIVAPIVAFITPNAGATDDPWANVPIRVPPTSHADLMPGPYETGQEVTVACLECHEDAADQVMHTTHWTWKSEPVQLPGRDELVQIGKANQINNFCIGTQGNEPGCTRCHIGYGWEDANFDFDNKEAVDCLACHADTATYTKGLAGIPVEGVDLAAAAQSVSTPTRAQCGSCHFNGGGGNAVKHGDLDESLYYPNEEIDVHMGRFDFLCVDCHQTDDHNIKGRAISVSVDNENQVACTDCHEEGLHEDARVNAHVENVACQTCHIPEGAVRDATKMHWDWSTAGQDIEEDPHEYLKIKGSFVYERGFMPEYTWYNGTADRYILGDEIDPTQSTLINEPLGGIDDETAKLWPFKVHRANQIYDAIYNYLLQPKTVGEGGYWTDFDWDQAARLGAEATGMAYSGEYGFAPTEMYWSLSHMVAPKESALQCDDCHGENGRMNWEELGYYGDPLTWGGREQQALLNK